MKLGAFASAVASFAALFLSATPAMLFAAEPSIFDDSSSRGTPAARVAKAPTTKPATQPTIPPPFDLTEQHKFLSDTLDRWKQKAAEARTRCEDNVRSTIDFKAAEEAFENAKVKLDRARETGSPQDRLDASSVYVSSKQSLEKMLTRALGEDRALGEATKRVGEAQLNIVEARKAYEAWRLAEVERQIPGEVKAYFAVIDADKRRRDTEWQRKLESLVKERETAAAKLRSANAMDVRRPPGFGITDVGGIDQSRAAARQTAINSANRELNVIDEKLRQLETNRPENAGTIKLDLSVGAVGVIGGVSTVQVVDRTNVIASYRNKLLWLSKHPTTGMVDDALVEIPGTWKITTTKRYTTAIGGTNTVFLAEPFSEPFIEYRPLVDFVRASKQEAAEKKS